MARFALVSLLPCDANKSQQRATSHCNITSMSITRAQWIALIGATAVASLAMGALLPTKWVPRTGLGWEVEHFLIYFLATFILCAALRRPLLIAGLLLLFSGALEWLQNFTPDRTPDLTAAFAGGSGAILAAALFEFLLRARRSARGGSI